MSRTPQYSFAQFFTTKRLRPTFDFAPDGRAIAYVADYSGYYNLYRQDLDGGEPRQLTDSQHLAPNLVVWAPDGYIYFLADLDGDEQSNLYRIPEGGGEIEGLTNQPGAQYVSLRLSRDGGALLYTGNPITPNESHLFRRDLATGKERLLGGGPGLWTIGYESASGRYLTFTQALSRTNVRLHLWDATSGTLRELSEGQPAARRQVGPWQGSGETFLFLSDEEGEFSQGFRYDVASASKEPVIAPASDVVVLFGTKDGRTSAFVTNEHGYFKATLIDPQSGMHLPTPAKLHGGVIDEAALSPDGSKLALLLNPPNRPAELLVWDRTTNAVTQITDCLQGNLDPAAMVTPERITIAGPDHPIPAWLYRPTGLAPDQQVPILLSFHGGPEAQELPTWEPLYQYLLDLGIAILAPNIRGSNGYGKRYQHLIYRDWGGGDLRDMEACAQWAQAQTWVKPGKLAVFGASYGGFATLSCATRLPAYWACAVDFCGPSNLVTLAKTLPPSFKPRLKGWLGDPEEDRAFLL
ncbi:MAG TPA: prolyl oligopeptidase family serine peptidase, partial [Symbiobacteriaceae bacterium]|nr:prolyl oligopeptidase family serine peptidase [Symbiobacteriaceae bacterium]